MPAPISTSATPLQDYKPPKKKRWDINPPGSKMVTLQKEALTEVLTKAREEMLSPLEAQKTKITTAVGHVGGLRQSFQALSAATYSLTNFATWPLYAFQGMASDGAVSIATTSSATLASTGDIEVDVVATARADRITSNTGSVFASATTALSLSGNLVLNGGAPIAITAGDTLNTIASKIQSQSNVRAWVTQLDTNQYVLTLSSPDLCVPIDGSASDAGIWSGLKLPATTAVSSLQANLTVNGVSNIMRSTNTVNDVVPGVQLVLNKPSTTPTTGVISEDTTTFNNNLLAFVAAYNACQQVVAAERAANPNDPTQAVSTAVLKDYDAFRQIESVLRVPFESVSANNLTFGSFGYKLQNGQLVIDTSPVGEAIAAMPLTMQARKNFFATNATVSSSNFTQTMSSAFDKSAQSNINILNGKAITVTITHNMDTTYTATLSATGLTSLTLPYDPVAGSVMGTGSFAGVNVTYVGTAIAPGDNATATVTFHQGAANNLYRAVDAAITTYGTNPSMFDVLANEIQSEQTNVESKIKNATDLLDAKSEKTLKGSGDIAALETKLKSFERMVIRAIHGKNHNKG